MKFVILAEGKTEGDVLASFIKRWIDPKLQKPVGVQIVQFGGWSDLCKGSPKKAEMHLNKSDVIAVFALLDLYGPDIYPADKKNASERFEWAKKDLENKVGHSKFRQFFAVHEIEAWLLSDPNIFPLAIKSALPGKISKPEEVNFNEPPAKLLDRLYKDKTKRSYKKTVNKKELFDKLDPTIAYGKCPRLKEFLDEMLKMAKAAGL